jgi:hypothetical protein
MSKIKAFTAKEFSGFAGFLILVEGQVNCGQLDVQPTLTENNPQGENPNILLLTAQPATDQQPESFQKVSFSKNEMTQGQYQQVQIVDPKGNALETVQVQRQPNSQPITNQPTQAKIFRVDTVTIHILKTNPPILAIQASGTVGSSGWKNGKLIPYIYVKPPADGIYEFDFVAEQPSGITLPVLLPITAEGQWENFPPTLKGIRVYSSTNNSVAMLSDARELAMLEGGGGGAPHGLFSS